MTHDDPLLHSPLDEDVRAAHRALRALVPPNTPVAAADDYLPIIVDDLEDLVRIARDTAAARLGPTHRWLGPASPDNAWEPVTLQLDFDTYSNDYPPGASRIHDWDTSALALAARAYRRECRWDHSPDEAGIWLLSVAPYSSIGSDDQTSWSGTLTGFVILHDRDVDGEYESLAHLWTAQEWRRRGVAAGLVRQALARFAVRQVEAPVTQKGSALLDACAPGLL